MYEILCNIALITGFLAFGGGIFVTVMLFMLDILAIKDI